MIKDTDYEYNKEPVHYCKNCGSLSIYKDSSKYYCKKCSKSDIGETSINNWEEWHRETFHKDYLTNEQC